MTKIILMNNRFGKLCANGDNALFFLKNEVLPIANKGEDLIFDFENVRNMNSSFSNALFANLIMQKGMSVLDNVKFKNCGVNIQLSIKAALELGCSKINNKVN